MKESWVKSSWRPVMAWLYMLTCTCDFIIFPVLWNIFQLKDHVNTLAQWAPITLQNGGLYHLTMAAVLGITAYGRNKEKTLNEDPKS